MAILNFSDVLRNVGLDPKRVKLIRHSLGDKAFKKCYDKNMVEEYTRVQSETFSNGYDYWCVFISDKSATAKFFACYKVNGGVIDTQDTKPKGFPLEDWFQGQRMFYNLERIDLLKEYEGRLLIEWGKSALAWAQKGTNEKPIVAIRDKKIFSYKFYPYLLMVIIGGLSLCTSEGTYSILITIGLIINTFALSLTNPQATRYCMAISCSFIFAYNVFVFSIGGMMNEAVAITSSVLGIIRHRKTTAPSA